MTNKQFKEMTIAEKFVAIAMVVENEEMATFLQERAEQQAKANKRERKSSATSNKLQESVLALFGEDTRYMADDVLTLLEADGYEDDHKTGLTIARVRNALSSLAKEEMLIKHEADRKKDSKFPKVSYELA